MRECLGLFCVMFFFASNATSQEGEVELTKTQEILQIAKTNVEEVQGRIDGSDMDLEPIGPFYTFSDSTRMITSGTVWFWGKQGRPVAIMTLSSQKGRRYFEFRSMSDQKLKFKVLGRAWEPLPSWDPIKIEDGPEPASTKPRRLFQMKELVARFRCEVIERNDKRTPLQVLPKPIYRYEDKEKQLDGCVFAMCREGDPEAILVIESTASGWQFMGGTMTAWDPVLYLDEKPYELEGRTSPKMSYIFLTRTAAENEK